MDIIFSEKETLPANIDQLNTFLLFSEEKFKNISVQIKSIEKLGLGQEVYKKKLEEGQKIAEQVLDAKVKLGELLNNNIKKGGTDFQSSTHGTLKQLPPGINKKQSHEYQELFRNKDIVEHEKQKAREVEDLVTTRNCLKEIKDKKREEQLNDKKKDIKKTFTFRTLEEIKNHYDVVYADPPWQYDDKGETKQLSGYGTVKGEYLTMSLSDIKNMEVHKLQKKDCILFLWVTSPYLEMSFEVINLWGFKYKSSFVWDKNKHNMGFYNSVRHEFLLIATKGSITPWNKKLFDSVYSEDRTEHSRKPEYFYEVIETLYPGGDYIELFARNKRKGWDSWGNE